MSAKGRAAEGYVPDANGFFQTQPQVTRALLPYLGIDPNMTILEPSCGKGAIARVLRQEYGVSLTIVGVEIDKKRAAAARKATTTLADGTRFILFDDVVCADFFELQPGVGPMGDWNKPFDRVLTNPSFSIWLPFAEHCFKFGPHTTLLLPFNSAASKKRAAWWRKHPAHLRVLSKRPSFAISVKCIASTKEGRRLGLADCDYQQLFALDAKLPTECPQCSEKLITTSSDASEYAWTTWSPEITRGLWDVIDTPTEGAP